MDLDLDDEQERIRDIAREVADTRLRPRAAERDRNATFPTDDLRHLADLGLMGVNVPETYGGSEAGVVAYSLAITEISRGDPAVSVTMAVNNMVCEVINEFGTAEQREATIPRIQSGEWAGGSFCLSEPGSGSDAGGMKTRATRTDDGWSISGTKAWITTAAHAGIFLVWARTDIDGSDSISLFLVDPASEGITVGKPEEKMGQHASNTAQIAFDDVRVPKDAVLGEVGQGFRIAMMALDGGRIGIASQALGIAVEASSLARAHVSRLLEDGPANASVEAARMTVSDMATDIDAARMLTWRAAWLKEQGDRRFTREASMAKLFSSEVACRTADAALEILGPAAGERHHPAAKLLRDARVTRIYEGTSEIQRIVIGREIIRNGV